MRIAWVKWKDAGHGLDEISLADATLVELEECGYLADEKPDCIVLALEKPRGDGIESTTTIRGRVVIPRAGIIEMKVAEFDAVFKRRKSYDWA